MRVVSDSFSRLAELILVIFMLPVALPLLLGLGLAIRLTSPGPVLLKLKCETADGRSFLRYRFRSIYVDARARAFRAAMAGADECGELDPRLTPIGAFMLRSGLNHLPQLWNVLRGEMDLFEASGLRPVPVAEPRLALVRLRS